MAHKNKNNISPQQSRQGKTHQKPQRVLSANEANDHLFDIFKNHHIDFVSHLERQKLAEFYELLMNNQSKENFTRLLTIKDIAIKHFIDCIIISKLTDFSFPLLDLGTGPGFPGIPLKILYPKEKIILAEGVRRRVEFIKNVRQTMKLENLDIIGRNITPFFAYPVNGVITRAVEDVRNTLKKVLTCLNYHGRVYFMKGPNVDPEIHLAEKEVGAYYKLEKDIPYQLPNTPHERRLLIYRKIKAAPIIDFENEPWPEDSRSPEHKEAQ